MNTQSRTPGEIPRRYYGKYRGLVADNVDPEQLGRIQAQVNGVLGENPSTWAMPCVPAAGIQSGCFVVPPIGSQVWIEFEQGDPAHPIWTGGFWGSASEIPSFAIAPPPLGQGQNIVFQTSGQNMVLISDSASTPDSGGIVLKSAGGARIVVNGSGIYIDNGNGATITLLGDVVAMNTDALTVK